MTLLFRADHVGSLLRPARLRAAFRVEAAGGTPAAAHAELAARIQRDIRADCEVRAVVEVVEPGTLPRTEFKAKRVTDLRATG